MAIISAGYDGTVDEVQFAGMLAKGGASEYGVDRASDLRVTPVAGQDRTLSIAPGIAWGHSVVDEVTTNETVQLAPISSGTRYDMIVLRRNWQPPGGSTTIAVVQGGSTGSELPTRITGMGVQDDQPLALVQVRAGQTQPGEVIDLRCWGRNGGLVAKDTRVLQYLGALGASVTIGDDEWKRQLNSANQPEWRNVRLSLLGNITGGETWMSIASGKAAMRLATDGAFYTQYDGNNRFHAYASGAIQSLGPESAYNRTYNGLPNLYVTTNGFIGRATEAPASETRFNFEINKLNQRIASLESRIARLEK